MSAVHQEKEAMAKVLWVDAICGAGFGSTRFTCQAEKQGFVTFIGDQHNEAWQWDRKALEKMSQNELAALYAKIKAEAQS